MGYRSNIRIITSKDGYERLKEFVKDNNKDFNLLEECDIKQKGKMQCYFGWNYVKWYEDVYPEVIAIMDGLNNLEENEYSYRYMRIGESYDDIEERFYDGEKDKDLYLEFPSMIREFDDNYIEYLIKEQQNEKEENKEEIDI